MIEIVETAYSKDKHDKILMNLMNQYAEEVRGKNTSLSDFTQKNLINELERRNNIVTFIAFVDKEPAGFAICIEGFSTFKCKSLLNIHDLYVKPEFRGKGLSKKILKKIEILAIDRKYCKITLEVLENNTIAFNLYKSSGFVLYELDPKLGKALFIEKKL